MLDVGFGDPWGDDPLGKTAAVSVEVERVLLSIWRLLGVRQVIWANSSRRLVVVVEAAGLVEGDDEESVLPLWGDAEGVVDLLEEDLAGGDGAGWVHGVGGDAAAGGVDVGVRREGAEQCVLEELLEGDDVAGLFGSVGPVVEQSIGLESAVGPVVVLPGNALAGQLLEN